MLQEYFLMSALLAPALLGLTSVLTWVTQRRVSVDLKRVALIASAISILSTAICGLLVIDHGTLESALIGVGSVGFSLRLDGISVTMLLMIALLGFVIVRFSLNYLDGEKRQDIFVARLTATLASIHLLVMSGNIGLLYCTWILTSVCLHRLLLFYPERNGAVIAAKKKFFVARLGDLSLFVAFALLYMQFGSGDLGAIINGVKAYAASGASSGNLEAAATFIVLAGVLKSAQFPTHGWLIEIMETPTPVSALLHAGLLNAGPFLIIRMAHVMDATTIAPVVLVIIGGFTALFASASYMTQTSIKTALGYSSVAHMGFSLMLGGLGVYTAAMLHLVAHSFYKAHAFLSSGSVIDTLRASKVAVPKRVGSTWRIAAGIAIALTLCVASLMLWSVNVYEEFAVLTVASFIMMGLIISFSSALDSKASGTVLFKTAAWAVLVITAFFSLEAGTRLLLGSELPELSAPGIGKTILMMVMVVAFASLVLVQVLAVSRMHSSYGQALAIHLRNGLYVNALFDKIIGAWSINTSKRARIEKLKVLTRPEVDKLQIKEQPASYVTKKIHE